MPRTSGSNLGMLREQQEGQYTWNVANGEFSDESGGVSSDQVPQGFFNPDKEFSLCSCGLGSHWRVPSKEVIDLVCVQKAHLEKKKEKKKKKAHLVEVGSVAKFRVEAVRPNYKAIVVTWVRVDGGLKLVSSRGGGEKEIGDLLWWQNLQDRRVHWIRGLSLM